VRVWEHVGTINWEIYFLSHSDLGKPNSCDDIWQLLIFGEYDTI